jgi:S1-C subfamily serine protease
MIWTENISEGVRQARKHLQRGETITSLHADLVNLDQDFVESVSNSLFPKNSSLF